ncbi:ferric reductase family protein [Aspergillus thermomutatus]|uniref:FAD-binding FR-type domain-containing protein n=1 Tax=Aspergillus thermomutatus TaxID=41047 RepID=A0A397HQM9_ASPTH|nr:uncharacterized protein CDV56_107923 [Aspergillus thermomutatus]RHZ65509.1 hypothetical protein CDV56_107923 [Aspergillus thermomutatus]
MRLTSLLLSVSGVGVFALGSPISCVSAIEKAISDFKFPNEESACTGNLSVHSLWAAAKTYCSPEEIRAGSAYLLGNCDGGELVPYSQIEPQLTEEYMQSLPVVNFENLQERKLWHTAVLLSPELYTIALQSQVINEREMGNKSRYGWALYGFWGGVLLMGMLNNILSTMFHYRLARQVVDVEGEKIASHRGPLKAIHHWVKAKLIIPATMGSHHQRLFGIATVPTRLETIVVCCYWALNLILGAVSHEATWPNTGFPIPYQLWQKVANRVITLAVFNLPWVWLFAGRNNIFLWLTGWSYTTFSIFHRNVARIIFVEAVVHASCWTVMGHFDGQYFPAWHKLFWRMGVVAICSFGMIILFSFSPFRKHFYEFFLLAHIAFAVLALVGVFYHTSIWNGRYNPYLWSVVAIWAFDRTVRVLRLCYYNLRLGFSTDMLDSLATIRYSQETDVIQLEVTAQRKTLAPSPGEHYFLYRPLRWRGWESHPFTLAAWEPVESPTVTQRTAVEHAQVPRKSQAEYVKDEKSPYSTQARSGPPSTTTLSDIEETWQRRKLVFWVRPCSGWTRSLRDACLKQPHLPLKTKLLIEGPYGHTMPLHTYDNVLFLIGGTGISVATSYLTDHMRRSTINPPRTRTKNIKLLWAVRQAQHVVDTFDGPVGPVFRCDAVSTVLYATGDAEISQKAKDLGIISRRPNVRDEIFRYVEEACPTERTAVLMCGPAGMADAVRDAIKTVVNNGQKDVEYFEEAYGW